MRLEMADARMPNCPGQGYHAAEGCIGDGHGWFDFTVAFTDKGDEYTCKDCGIVFIVGHEREVG